MHACLFFFTTFLSHAFCLWDGDKQSKSSPDSLLLLSLNCNSQTKDNYWKVSGLKAYSAIHNSDFICVSETFLDSSIQSDDIDLMIDGYNLFLADHPRNTERGDVCIYYKESVLVSSINITALAKCLVYETNIQNQKGYVIVVYSSASQNNDEFDDLISEFENMVNGLLQ